MTKSFTAHYITERFFVVVAVSGGRGIWFCLREKNYQMTALAGIMGIEFGARFCRMTRLRVAIG